MMMQINQIQAVAAVVAALRPEWGEQGVRAALLKVDSRDPYEVALAAIKAAREPSNRTPAVIALGGDHWHDAKPAKDARHVERMAEARARAAAIRNCSLCDDKGYRLPRALTLCTHRELRGRGRA